MVVLKNSYTIKPAEPTPTSGICISDCDQDKPITHASFIYFYPAPSNGISFASVIETLKVSLAKTLVYFYPLAGRLYWTDRKDGRVELKCNSEGTQFDEAEWDGKIADLGDFCPNKELRAFAPAVDYCSPLQELPLLMVQVTKFSCGGISIGMASCHIIADGTSMFHFMASWAKIARGEPLDVLPFLDRTALLGRDPPVAPPRFHHERFVPPPLLIGQSDSNEERNKETTVSTLRLRRSQVEKLLNMANVGQSASIRPYSRFEAVAGHMWRCISQVRELKSNQITKLYSQVDFRHRMRPISLPQGYFGNAILRIAVASRSGELLMNPLSYASRKIREAIESVSDEYVREALDLVKSQQDLSRFRTSHVVGSSHGAFYGNPNLEITSWVGLPLRRVDFGWGNEIHVCPAAVAFDGKSFIYSGSGGGSGSDGDESWMIAVRLQVDHMDAFKKIFYKDISDGYGCKL